MDFIKLFSGGFPLTIERLIFVQETYKKAFEQFSTVLGDGTHYIISGVEVVNVGGTDQLTDGVVCINGEILPFVGGVLNTNVIVRSTSITVPYNEDTDSDGNLDQKAADTTRICYANPLTNDADDELHPYASFERVPQLTQLMPTIGDVKLITRAFDPVVDKGWELMDMADAFPIAAGGAHSVNAEGGTNERTILKANLPAYNLTGSTSSGGSHNHPYRDSYFIEAFESPNDVIAGYNSQLVGSNFRGSGDTDADNRYIWYRDRSTSFSGSHSHTVNLPLGGSGTPLSIKPKYKAFNFLRFVGF